jgi:hypothetical protein
LSNLQTDAQKALLAATQVKGPNDSDEIEREQPEEGVNQEAPRKSEGPVIVETHTQSQQYQSRNYISSTTTQNTRKISEFQIISEEQEINVSYTES